MLDITVPYSGRFLISHMAAYGLASVIDAHGGEAWIGHGPDMEMTPFVATDLDPVAVNAAVRQSAHDCEAAIEEDLEPGKSGNDRIPVIRARATDTDRARRATKMREARLDQIEGSGGQLCASLLAGLGAPSPWVRDPRTAGDRRPEWGATRLDGVAYNYPSDIVRAALRKVRAAAAKLDGDSLQWTQDASSQEADHFLWSPPGTTIDPIWQWLAAMGLTLLPVGATSRGRARTPGFWDERASRGGTDRGITLPVLSSPVSVQRLRCLVQLEQLAARTPTDAARLELRALGISALAVFVVDDASTGSMVQFSFGAATPIILE